ncbi:MAG: hypothetical protein ABRQ26_02145 [Syntrophomonadaceae bacterium]
MRIGIDIDNTITSTSEVILKYAQCFGRENHLNIIPNQQAYLLEDVLGWPRPVVERFFASSLLDIYTHVKPRPMAVEIMREWSSRHDLVIITSRQKYSPGIEQATREWLGRHRVVYHKLIMNTTSDFHYSSKVDACLDNGVEIMLEDHHDQALELSRWLPVLLFTYPYNEHIQAKNVRRVKDWLEVKNIVRNLEEGCQNKQEQDVSLPGILPIRFEEG